MCAAVFDFNCSWAAQFTSQLSLTVLSGHPMNHLQQCGAMYQSDKSQPMLVVSLRDDRVSGD